jgi:hypothetical protein
MGVSNECSELKAADFAGEFQFETPLRQSYSRRCVVGAIRSFEERRVLADFQAELNRDSV